MSQKTKTEELVQKKKEIWQPNEVINTILHVDFKNKAKKNFNKIISEIWIRGH